MKILMHSSLDSKSGGAQNVFTEVSQRLAHRGHVIIKSHRNKSLKAGDYRVYDTKLETCLRVPKKFGLFGRRYHFSQFIRSLIGTYRILRKHEPDVVYYHFFKRTAVVFALLKPVLGFKFVIGFQGSDLMQISGMEKKLLNFVLRMSDATICTSKALNERLTSDTNNKSAKHVTIYNGTDFKYWNRASHNRLVEGVIPKRIISVGSLRRVKGHDILISAFDKVLHDHPNARLRIVGEGPNRPVYESQIASLGLSEHIDLTGWLPQDEVRDHLRRASLFVFSSRSEGFGLALVEAMAAGLPVLASSVGGIPEVVPDTDMCLMPRNDVDGWASKISSVLSNPTWMKKISKLSVQRARMFDWETCVNGYETLFLKLSR